MTIIEKENPPGVSYQESHILLDEVVLNGGPDWGYGGSDRDSNTDGLLGSVTGYFWNVYNSIVDPSPKIGLPAWSNAVISVAVYFKDEALNAAGTVTLRISYSTAVSIVFTSVDVVDAYKNGTTADVVTQVSGLAGALAGAEAGAAAGGWIGASIGSIGGPQGAAVGGAIVGFAGGIAGAVLGEAATETLVQEIQNSIQNAEIPYELQGANILNALDQHMRAGLGPINWSPGGGLRPVVLDLDEDGIEIGTNPVNFDFDGDGYKEAGAWVSSNDGFLVIDRDSETGALTADNYITRGDELALSMLTPGNPNDTDLEALAASTVMNSDQQTIAFTGSDGVTRNIQVFNANDDGWDYVRVWRDLNQNGVVDGGLYTTNNANGELFTLDALGITQINLGYDDGSAFTTHNDDITVGLATLNGLASFVRHGVTIEGGVGDVALGHADLGYRRVAAVTC